MKMLKSVYKAEPYRHDAMGSLGDANGMLLRQSKFPDAYDDRDIHVAVDHDRLLQWDYRNTISICQKHIRTGDMGIGSWVKNASHDEVIAFFKEIMKIDDTYPDVKWTGFRLLGWVNRSNGCPIFHMELFAKHPDSDTEVYTGANAPNVLRGRR